MADDISDSSFADESVAEDQEAYGADEALASDKVADLVEYIVCGLVNDQDAVSLDVTDREDGALIEVSCAAEDAGRVIGRRGRHIQAVLILAHSLASLFGPTDEVKDKW